MGADDGDGKQVQDGVAPRVSEHDAFHGRHKKASSSANVALPTEIITQAATLGSKSNALNWTWGILMTSLLPAVASIIWFGLIPVGPSTGDAGDKALWVFFINPASMTGLSFLLLSVFFSALHEDSPYQPLANYLHIILASYMLQVIFPGLFVLLDAPFGLMALVTSALSFIVVLVGLYTTPPAWFGATAEHYRKTLIVFKKICIVVYVFLVVLAGYNMANGYTDGAGQGFLTLALTIIGFILKKILLAYTDTICIETAMLVAGFWLENLSDVFITLAFPTAQELGPTFAIIFLSRIAENLAYLFFQLNTWFRFRVWIKGKFKKDQASAIEDDNPEFADDRGHSAHHPGYRRRQLRFLAMKIFSQVSSYLYYMALVPVLRFGPNKRRFPFSASPSAAQLEGSKLLDTEFLDAEQHYLPKETFEDSLLFSAASIVAALMAGALIWAWMHHYHKGIIVQLRELYNGVVVQAYHYGLVVSIMLVNSLLGTAFVQTYYRVYFF